MTPRSSARSLVNIAVVLVTVGGVPTCSQQRHRGTFTDPAECERVAAAMNDTHDTTVREMCISEDAARSMGVHP